MDYRTQIKKYIDMEQKTLSNLPIDSINTVINVLENTRINRHRIFICGNGGSAATASHFECDFNKGISLNQTVKYDIECLNDNVPTMMAIANDIGYDDIFVVPLQNKLKQDDVVVGISGSGNSRNVIKALMYANDVGAHTIAFVGYDGGELKRIARHSVHVNIDDMQITEDIHMILDHMMTSILSGRILT